MVSIPSSYKKVDASFADDLSLLSGSFAPFQFALGAVCQFRGFALQRLGVFFHFIFVNSQLDVDLIAS